MAGGASNIQQHVVRDNCMLQAIEDWYKQVHESLELTDTHLRQRTCLKRTDRCYKYLKLYIMGYMLCSCHL